MVPSVTIVVSLQRFLKARHRLHRPPDSPGLGAGVEAGREVDTVK
jgi:hypothetical protein